MTTSLVIIPRETASCFPSDDQSNQKISSDIESVNFLGSQSSASSDDDSSDSTSLRSFSSPAHWFAKNSARRAGSYDKAAWNKSSICYHRSAFYSKNGAHRPL